MNLVFFEDVDFKDIRFLMDLYDVKHLMDVNLINTYRLQRFDKAINNINPLMRLLYIK